MSVQPRQPRWWLGPDAAHFGHPDAPDLLRWRPTTQAPHHAARRAALMQHLVVTAFRIEVQRKWPGRPLNSLGQQPRPRRPPPSPARLATPRASPWANLPRLRTVTETQAWNLLRGLTPMTLVHVDDMARLVGIPLLALGPWATNFADNSALDLKRTAHGHILRGPSHPEDLTG